MLRRHYIVVCSRLVAVCRLAPVLARRTAIWRLFSRTEKDITRDAIDVVRDFRAGIIAALMVYAVETMGITPAVGLSAVVYLLAPLE